MSQQKVSAWQSILAGGVAGGAEILITVLPSGTMASLIFTREAWRSVLSNSCKSGVRFFAFNTARQWMPTEGATANSPGKVTPLGNLLAGVLAGVAESILVVTPGETLKTKIIDDQGRQYKSAGHAVRSVVASEGIAGLYRGVAPVTLKQSANAMVRFTSYNLLLSQLQAWGSRGGPDGTLSKTNTVIAGALAGVVTVYATMPFDTLKTRLQAIDGRQRYSGTFDCLKSIMSNEGATVLWRGTTPRLARLSVGLLFIMNYS
ncbi:hypothetical protein UA08_07869 [Talaromyces atroroseus]|uniref:Mitochondrial thiamine pyrophosphate carrier 1 n=1 Tax=Talaromyces atroroseus TaxID=1441469 RepID=A0A225A8G7_TALAT|nr:hypothetical protein UA08_07869 [Talaromyces atroroseus]OKL56922.1 hypothetical protein UA08_07869 [Talaromyces atroroseus]